MVSLDSVFSTLVQASFVFNEFERTFQASFIFYEFGRTKWVGQIFNWLSSLSVHLPPGHPPRTELDLTQELLAWLARGGSLVNSLQISILARVRVQRPRPLVSKGRCRY